MFKKLIKDRYGGDQLSTILLGLSVLLTIIGSITKVFLLTVLSFIPLAFAIFRMFSKNTSKRRMENYKFSIFMAPVYSKYRKFLRKFKERKTHKYIKCTNCKTELRLPKNKGRITITCPKCRESFEGRT